MQIELNDYYNFDDYEGKMVRLIRCINLCETCDEFPCPPMGVDSTIRGGCFIDSKGNNRGTVMDGDICVLLSCKEDRIKRMVT